MNRRFSKEDIHGRQTCEKMLNMTHHQGNPNPNHSELTSHLSEWLTSKTQETTGVDEDVEKGEPSYTVGGNAN